MNDFAHRSPLLVLPVQCLGIVLPAVFFLQVVAEIARYLEPCTVSLPIGLEGHKAPSSHLHSLCSADGISCSPFFRFRKM
jgi:hypothetical protein